MPDREITPRGGSPIADACLAALGELGGSADAGAVRGWLAGRDRPLTPRQVRSGLHRLSISHPRLAECAERRPERRGRAGVWRLTAAGRVRLGLDAGPEARSWLPHEVPLGDGESARLVLPADLTGAEAGRLCAVILSLAAGSVRSCPAEAIIGRD
jgi:hypothetical protein